MCIYLNLPKRFDISDYSIPFTDGFQYRQSEQVIIEDRLEKENLCKQLEKGELERNAATKVNC